MESNKTFRIFLSDRYFWLLQHNLKCLISTMLVSYNYSVMSILLVEKINVFEYLWSIV